MENIHLKRWYYLFLNKYLTRGVVDREGMCFIILQVKEPGQIFFKPRPMSETIRCISMFLRNKLLLHNFWETSPVIQTQISRHMTSSKSLCLLSKVDHGENIPKSHLANLEEILKCSCTVKRVEVEESGSGEGSILSSLVTWRFSGNQYSYL